MKFQKLSLALVFAGALAIGVCAQGSNQDQSKPKPKPKPAAHPKPSTHKSHTAPSSSGHGSQSQNPTPSSHPAPVTHTSQGHTTTGGHSYHRASGSGNPGRTAGNGAPIARTGGTQKLAIGTPVKAVGGQTYHVGSATKTAPAIVRGRNAPPKSAFVNPSQPVSSHNYPTPHYGNTYITNNTTVINNNYRYDSAHYEPHVANFYGRDSDVWGGHWRYGCVERPGVTVSFGFGFYAYTPYYAQVVASPWYYYPGVPAYVPQSRVIILSDYDCNWGDGDVYAYRPGVAWDSYGDYPANHAMDDLIDAYVDTNANAINDILDPDQNIAVFSEGNYEYSLNADDFRQTLQDNLQATQTQSFRITAVRHRPGRMSVWATHVFTLPDDSTETVYQLYRFQREGDRWIVTDFMTSHQRYNLNGF